MPSMSSMTTCKLPPRRPCRSCPSTPLELASHAGCGRDVAAVHTVAAVVARGPLVVRAREQRLTHRDHRDADGRAGFFQHLLAAAEGQRRQVMLAGRHDVEAVVLAADTDDLFYLLVAR